MKRESLENLQIIEYLKRTKEDTTIEEHRMALDAAIKVFEKIGSSGIIIMSKRTVEYLLPFVKQTIIDAQEELDRIDPEDKLLVGVYKNGLNFWNDIKDALEHPNTV